MLRRLGRRGIATAAAIAAASVLVAGQITVPNTFVNGTVADAPQVNANFNALAANALNRAGGTMTGTLTSRDVIPSADTTYDAGTALLAFRDLYVKRNTILNGQTYSWPSAHGANGAILTENGSGTLTWSSTSGSIGRCDLRLTLTTATPVTMADVTAATSVFVTPTPGAQCAFYDGAATWSLLSSIAEVTVAVPATTSTLYDVFCFNNAGTMACDAALAWTNDTTRATALATQNAVYVKSGTTTRRYIGSFRTTTVSGQTEDSIAKRYVWNYYNRAPRPMQVVDTAASWAYTTNTLRQAHATATNQLDFIVGVSEAPVTASVIGNAGDTTSGAFMVGIGLDSTSVIATGVTAGIVSWSVSGAIYSPTATGRIVSGVGRHTLVWLEAVASGTSTTWYGKDKFQTGISSGISGTIDA